jgi:quercetin dioxygenase-like cupin family protein
MAIDRVVLNPGGQTLAHKHHTAEYLTVLSGSGRLAVAGRPTAQIRAATTILIPPETTHSVANASTTGAQLVLLAAHVGSRRNEDLDAGNGTHGCPPVHP